MSISQRNSIKIATIISFGIIFVALSFGLNISTGLAIAPEKSLVQQQEPMPIQWNWLNAVPQGNDLTTITCPAENFCYSVGYAGTILTNQHGKWELLQSGTSQNLFGLSCPTTQICYAAGDNGILLKTIDSGQSWLTKTVGVTTTLQKIDCPTTTNCYLKDYSAQNFFVTENGGDSWSNRTPSAANLKDFSCPTFDSCYVFTGYNFYSYDKFITKTVDSGLNWSSQVISVSGSQASYLVDCIDSNTCFAGLNTGSTKGIGVPPNSHIFTTLLKTTDGGLNWLPQGTAQTFPILTFGQLTCKNETTCYGVGRVFNGFTPAYFTTLVKTTDSGASWITGTINMPATPYYIENLTGMDCVNQSCYAVGKNGMLLKSTDGGLNWNFESSGHNLVWSDIECITYNSCLVSNYNGSIYKIADNIIQVITLTDSPELVKLSCPDWQVCYSVTTNNTFLTTNDSWQTWLTHTLPFTNSISLTFRLECPVSQVCYILARNGKVYRTGDDGLTWLDRSPTFTKTLTALKCVSNEVCYAGNNAFYKTTDGGLSWQLLYTPELQTLNVQDISCPEITVCYAVRGLYIFPPVIVPRPPQPPNYNLHKTVDGGATWVDSVFTPTSVPTFISCSTRLDCWRSDLKHTIDGGQTWLPDPTLSFASDYLYNSNPLVECRGGCVMVQGRHLLTNMPICREHLLVRSELDSEVCGTLRFATSHAQPGETIRFDLTTINSLGITLAQNLIVPPGVKLIGQTDCQNPNRVNLQGNGKLILSGENSLRGLQISGLQLTASSISNSLTCLQISRN